MYLQGESDVALQRNRRVYRFGLEIVRPRRLKPLKALTALTGTG